MSTNVTMQGDKVEIVLTGDKYTLSKPYTLSKTRLWYISVKPTVNEIKEKYKIAFVNKARADIFKRSNVNVIRFYRFVMIKDGEVETIFTSGQKDFDLYIEKQTVGYSQEDTLKDKERFAKEIFGNEMTEKELFGDDIAGDDSNINELLDAWEDYYQEKSDDAMIKAKNLLLSISDHYLTKDMLNSDIYIRNKMVIQAESLSMLFTQLSLTKQVLMKLFREIMSDIGNKVVYEAFAQQQKFVLEINGFMNKTIKEVIDDMKQAKERHKEKEEERVLEEEALEVSEGGGMVRTRDKKRFLAEIGDMIIDAENSIEDYNEDDVEENKRKREKELNIENKGDFEG
jgi:hypothetical protein